MRVTKLMGLAVLLVALAVTMNALAFKTVVVTNPATLTVTGTGTAALAISAATTPGVGFAASEGGGGNQRQWYINFQSAMQPNSVYTYSGVMKVSASTTDGNVTISNVTATAPAGILVEVLRTGTTTPLQGAVIEAGTPSWDVDVRVTVDPTYAGTGGNFNIQITANR